MEHLKRLAISCGGTGGHFLPGLAIAVEFNRNGGKALLLIGGKHIKEQMESARKAGVDSCAVTACAPSGSPAGFARFLWRTGKGFLESCRILRDFQPQAFLSMGSFASLPGSLAAAWKKIPLFLHDGNALLGKMNLFMSRWARAFAASFPPVNEKASRCPVVMTGLPIRPDLLSSSWTKEQAVSVLNERFQAGFSPDRPLILVFGGSLGARTLNEMFYVDPAMPDADHVQVVQLTGRDDAECQAVREKWSTAPCRVLVLKSFQEMQILYSAADLVICRAGGSTVSELACFGKYAVLVPFPFAAEHHQDANARWLLQEGGGIILQDSECSRERFSRLVADWMLHREEYAEKGRRSLQLARPDAAMNVLRLIEDLVFEREKKASAGESALS